MFIPMYERWVGMQSNPWMITDDVAVPVLQVIWDTIYTDVPLTVTPGNCVFQCTRDFLSLVFVACPPLLTIWLRSPNVSVNGVALSKVLLTLCWNSTLSLRITVIGSRTTTPTRFGQRICFKTSNLSGQDQM